MLYSGNSLRTIIDIGYTISIYTYDGEMMQKILFSLPDELVTQLRAYIPSKQRSKVVTQLLEKELKRREQALYQCALEVEADTSLNDEMKDWEITQEDGLDNEPW